MRITNKEKRTIKLGATLLLIYLPIFYGVQAAGKLEDKRKEYETLTLSRETLRRQIIQEQIKHQRLQKLRDELRIDLAGIDEDTFAARFSAAVEKAAQTQGVQLGPARETGGTASQPEGASLQIEGTGKTRAVVQFLHRLGNLGFPVAIDSVQLRAVAAKPGQVQLSVRTMLVNPSAWQISLSPESAATPPRAAQSRKEPPGDV